MFQKYKAQLVLICEICSIYVGDGDGGDGGGGGGDGDGG